MTWRKIGKIFCAENHNVWMKTHAMLPVPDHFKEDIYRIYFTTRDESLRGYTSFLTIDIKDPLNIIDLNLRNPVLELGNYGEFDEYGALCSSIINIKKEKLMYYEGIIRCASIPFQVFIGIAISEDNGITFRKTSNVPILDRSKYDPIMTSSPFVLKNNNIFYMYYLSGIKWKKIDEQLTHFYNIKLASSTDGYLWKRKGVTVIDFNSEFEYAIARPTIIKDDNLYKMWYSYRASIISKQYRIGYAESRDCIKWQRKDELAGIDISEHSWDSEMICYPYVFKHKNETYMLYNGNGYGKTGFGIAVLENN